MRSKLTLILKFGLVLGLFYVLFQRDLISTAAFSVAFGQWQYFGGAFFFAVASLVIGMWRWKLLLRAQGIHLSFGRIVELSLVGNFFNIALPGAVSGDVVKAMYVAAEAPGKRARAMSSIVFDRVVGVSCLVMVGALSLLLIWGSPSAAQIMGSIQAFLAMCGFGVIAFYTYLFALSGEKDPLFKILQKAHARFKWVGSFLRIYEGIHEYRNHRKIVAIALALSFVIHVMVVIQFYLLALAIGETAIPPLALAVVVPLSLLVTAVPILPGGVGTGHAAFLFFLRILGSDRGADLFNLNLVFLLFFAGVGGVVYLRFRKAEHSLLQVEHGTTQALSAAGSRRP